MTRQRSISQWKTLIAEQKESGLTIKQFCKQHDITPSSLYLWKQRLKKGKDIPEPKQEADWLPIDINVQTQGEQASDNHWDIELHLPSGIILKMSPQTC